MSLRLSIEEYHALCRRVLERDYYRCLSCGYRQNLSCHHVVFRSHGGEDTKENLCTLCECCHRAVHSRNLWIEFDMELPEVFHFIRKAGWRPK